jgi:Ras-related C3 botulinum toxin substrate 1
MCNHISSCCQKDYDRLRPLSYIGADIFLLCFDLVNHVSLQNSSERWIKELSLHAPNVPILLCGTKVCLFDSSNGKDGFAEKQKIF